ncbi:stage II sporulation protein M [Demequina sp. SYSU T00068]|uniref:stage II sporulation protein M n=1 Tax=Demequina lignilytica TaxID=3051663 RepID=UPI00260AF9D0|nr:stage II sporulation protein M [Demequina sp. SYSU T00068]MDN4490175.1 stage II sporulation protein M [Demequina sp. SYSU T00068]
MDIDSFSASRERRWARLKELAGARRLTGAEADELARLYQATAGDLSTVRSAAPEPTLVSRLSVLLASARVWLTGAHTASTREVARYLLVGLPAALHRVRWWAVAVTLAVLVMAFVSGWWTVTHEDALDLVGPPEVRAAIAQEEFASYYTEYDSTSFAATVWTNNGWLAAQCIAFGITGVYPLFLMYSTVLQLGVAGAIMAEAGALDIFFQLIMPHGLLELSAVFVAAGTGLRLCWTMLVPGPRPRSRALAEEGRAAVGVAIGLVIALLLSGLIEGYVTGSLMPWWLKIVIGVIAVTAFWMYIFVAGRAATRAGATGDAEGDFATDQVALAG